MADVTALAKRYLQAIESCVPSDELRALLHPKVSQRELPNPLTPAGQQRGIDGMIESYLKGQQILESQSYEVLEAIAAGSRVALRVLWRGRLKAAPPGLSQDLVVESAIFMRFEDDLLREQHNFDCLLKTDPDS